VECGQARALVGLHDVVFEHDHGPENNCPACYYGEPSQWAQRVKFRPWLGRTFHGFFPDLGPADCAVCGTFFAPGNFSRSWLPCLWLPAQEAGMTGHHVWRCGTCEAGGIRAVCYWPAHRPDGALQGVHCPT